MSSSAPVLHYWGKVRSRAEYPQFVAKFFGVPLDTKGDQPYPGTPEWATTKTTVLGQLPLLVDGDVEVGQTSAIVDYIASKAGLLDGASAADCALSSEVCQIAYELHGDLNKAHYHPTDRTAGMDEVLAAGGKVAKKFAVLDSLVKDSGFFGAKALPGDAVVAAIFSLTKALDASVLEGKYPKLTALHDKVVGTEAVAAYLETVPYPYFKRHSDAAPPAPPAPKPKLTYFGIAARAELCRLIAAAGGLEIDNVITNGSDLSKEEKAAHGTPSGVPILSHGDLKISQSLAIERYLADIAPKFASLTPQQRAIDGMFAAIKEDLVQGTAKVCFAARDTAPEAIPALMAKWMPIIEARIPAKGFINGLLFPTMADLTVLFVAQSYMPIGAALKLAGDAGGKKLFAAYPNFTALAERTAQVPSVKEYLSSNGTMTQAAFGL